MTKIIHQTWKTDSPPEDIFRNWWRKSWKDLNPKWEYRLWTDEDLNEYVLRNHPDFYDLWWSYPKQIMRVDAWRYLLLKDQGGLYVDLDIACLRPLDEWLTGYIEFASARQAGGNLCNAFMWAPNPDPEFLFRIKEALFESSRKADPLIATGPSFFEKYSQSLDIRCLEIEEQTIYPLNFHNRPLLRKASNFTLAEVVDRFPRANAISFWTGSWNGGFQSKSNPPPYLSKFQIPECPSPKIIFLVVCQTENHLSRDAQLATCLSSENSVFVNDSELNRRSSRDFELRCIINKIKNADFDWLVVLSDNTFVSTSQLNQILDDKNAEIVTGRSGITRNLVSSHEGYCLSRKISSILSKSEQPIYESDLLKWAAANTLTIRRCARLRDDSSVYPLLTNDCISAFVPDFRYHRLINSIDENLISGRISCSGSTWSGDLTLNEDGFCYLNNFAEGGVWLQFNENLIGLQWFSGRTDWIYLTHNGKGIQLTHKVAISLFGVDLDTAFSDTYTTQR